MTIAVFLAGCPAAASAAGVGTSLAVRTSQAVEAVHLKLELNGRTLVVHLTGPSEGEVDVTYVATYKGKKLAYGARTVTLSEGRKTMSFRLSASVASKARLSVNAKIADS